MSGCCTSARNWRSATAAVERVGVAGVQQALEHDVAIGHVAGRGRGRSNRARRARCTRPPRTGRRPRRPRAASARRSTACGTSGRSLRCGPGLPSRDRARRARRTPSRTASPRRPTGRCSTTDAGSGDRRRRNVVMPAPRCWTRFVAVDQPPRRAARAGCAPNRSACSTASSRGSTTVRASTSPSDGPGRRRSLRRSPRRAATCRGRGAGGRRRCSSRPRSRRCSPAPTQWSPRSRCSPSCSHPSASAGGVASRLDGLGADRDAHGVLVCRRRAVRAAARSHGADHSTSCAARYALGRARRPRRARRAARCHGTRRAVRGGRRGRRSGASKPLLGLVERGGAPVEAPLVRVELGSASSAAARRRGRRVGTGGPARASRSSGIAEAGRVRDLVAAPGCERVRRPLRGEPRSAYRRLRASPPWCAVPAPEARLLDEVALDQRDLGVDRGDRSPMILSRSVLGDRRLELARRARRAASGGDAEHRRLVPAPVDRGARSGSMRAADARSRRRRRWRALRSSRSCERGGERARLRASVNADGVPSGSGSRPHISAASVRELVGADPAAVPRRDELVGRRRSIDCAQRHRQRDVARCTRRVGARRCAPASSWSSAACGASATHRSSAIEDTSSDVVGARAAAR